MQGPRSRKSAAGLEGFWISDGDRLVDYPGGFDGFFRAQLTPNENGLAAQATYDELSGENPESTCIGRPVPGMIVNSVVYPIQIEFLDGGDRIAIRSEFFDEERIVHMDGRPHPDIGQRSRTGHSIGTLEDNVLIVDTRNFEDHRSPYQTGVPSGAQKHVVERYELSEDGTHILLEFMLEEPRVFRGADDAQPGNCSTWPDHEGNPVRLRYRVDGTIRVGVVRGPARTDGERRSNICSSTGYILAHRSVIAAACSDSDEYPCE